MLRAPGAASPCQIARRSGHAPRREKRAIPGRWSASTSRSGSATEDAVAFHVLLCARGASFFVATRSGARREERKNHGLGWRGLRPERTPNDLPIFGVGWTFVGSATAGTPAPFHCRERRVRIFASRQGRGAGLQLAPKTRLARPKESCQQNAYQVARASSRRPCLENAYSISGLTLAVHSDVHVPIPSQSFLYVRRLS
jgi:hypothetical protein